MVLGEVVERVLKTEGFFVRVGVGVGWWRDNLAGRLDSSVRGSVVRLPRSWSRRVGGWAERAGWDD